jgi:protocatechuate 3,4-dioxygenase beta subunit
MRPTRRDLLRTTLGLGAASALPRAWALGTAEPTPFQTVGPFYPVTRPLDADADLTLIDGHAGRAQGRIVHLVGRVLNARGEPVAGARIELWQANARGRYAHPVDANPAPLDPDFQGFGTQLTDAEGQYRFKTIKPGAYPINPMNPKAVRTPHIHFDISGKDSRLVTQLYFPGEPQNAADLIYSGLEPAEQRAVTGEVLPLTPDLEPGSLLLRWDVVLVSS